MTSPEGLWRRLGQGQWIVAYVFLAPAALVMLGVIAFPVFANFDGMAWTGISAAFIGSPQVKFIDVPAVRPGDDVGIRFDPAKAHLFNADGRAVRAGAASP